MKIDRYNSTLSLATLPETPVTPYCIASVAVGTGTNTPIEGTRPLPYSEREYMSVAKARVFVFEISSCGLISTQDKQLSA